MNSSNTKSITRAFVYLVFSIFLLQTVLQPSSFSSEVKETPEQIIEGVNKSLKDYKKPDCTAPEVVIAQGKLCGTVQSTDSGKKSHAYLGIPFAETTGGKNRWRPPVPDSGWEGTFEATEHGFPCPQVNLFDHGLPYSEDCLNLNVWVPAEASEKPRPVMLFIYGGAFLYGYNSDPLYDGINNSVNGDVVVVTINYRVSAPGFLAGVKDKKTGEKLTGNYGIQDQILAMKWVKDNIEQFGGDPDKITLQGQSAGAYSVMLHLLGPQSVQDLFSSAIVQSSPVGLPLKSLKEAKPTAKQFADNLGCQPDDINCMRSKPINELVKAAFIKDRVTQTLLHGLRDFLIWGPVRDGKIIKSHPLKEVHKEGIKKPLVIGTNKNEALVFLNLGLKILGLKQINDTQYSLMLDVLFTSNDIKNKILKVYKPEGDNLMVLSKVLTDYLFTCPTLYIADKSTLSTWVYLFDHIPSFNMYELIDLSFCGQAVCHGSELPFVFHTAQNLGFSFTEEEVSLSRVMGGYWTNFANKQNPNGGAPDWPEYKSETENVILVTPIDKIDSRKDLKAHCEFWHNIGYDLRHSFWDIF